MRTPACLNPPRGADRVSDRECKKPSVSARMFETGDRASANGTYCHCAHALTFVASDRTKAKRTPPSQSDVL